MKMMLRVIIGILFSSLFGHVVVAEEITLRVVSLEERLETLRAGITKGGYFSCGEFHSPIKVPYDSCARFSSLKGHGCFSYSTADMINENGYGRMCDEVELLQKARSPSVEYFNVDSPGWWKALPAGIAPGSTVWAEDLDAFDRSAEWELLKDRPLGDFEIAEMYSGSEEVALILDKWIDRSGDCGEYRDLFAMRRGVLADFDADGVAELRIHGFEMYISDCPTGSMEHMYSGYAITLKKTSPDGPVQRVD